MAALYFADARPGAAVDTIVKSLQNIDQNSVLPSREYEAALNGIRFLIEQRRISDATAGIERLASATSAYDRLLQLLQITKKHKLLSSGDIIRQSLEADAKSTRSVDTLLKIVSGLKSAEEPELAEAVVKQAKHRARTDEEVFELGRYYLNSGETGQAEEMFERILGGSPPLNMVEKVYAVSKEGNLHGPEKASLQSLVLRLQVADKRFDSYLAAALKARDTETVSYGIKKVYEADGLGDKYEAFIDKLVHYDVPDYVRMAYEIPLAGFGGNDPERQEEMQFIVDSALKRKLYDIAAKALYKLAVYLAGDIDKYRVVPPGILHDRDELPDPEGRISVQTLYGILNEKLGLMDKAGTQYMDAVGKDLAQINESYATDTPDLNDLYYLRRYLAQSQNSALFKKLQPVVDQMIQVYEGQAEKKNKLKVAALLKTQESKMEQLRSTNEEEIVRSRRGTRRSVSFSQRIRKSLKTIKRDSEIHSLSDMGLARLIALVVVLAIVVIGLVLQGWRYSREWEKNRYFAFIAKVTESYGFFCFVPL